MPTVPRVLFVQLTVLALLAWGATVLLNTTASAWFERDLTAHARVAVSAAREALMARLAPRDHARLAAVLEAIAREDQVLAVQACGASGETLAATRVLPRSLGCAALGPSPDVVPRPAPWRQASFRAALDGQQVHVSVVPLRDRVSVVGGVIVVHDLSYVAAREAAMRRLTLATFAVVGALAALVTLLVRRMSWRTWTHELRRLLILGRGARAERLPSGPFQPLLADVRRMASELAREESRASGGPWSAERLHRTLDATIRADGVLVVANREPYQHERAGDGTIRVRHPASGLVTALEPVMRACSGTWIAHGSGNADRETVDRDDRVRVPPGNEAYTLRRVWLTAEEERGYYYGFSNEGLWPLCHLAHTRPTFRAADWQQYQAVNAKFTAAVCQEAQVSDPVVLVQDYHFALVPRLVRQRLPRATVVSFWHVPWPDPERFGTCPWRKELLTGLLGSSVLGFHTQLHCNNFIESVERQLEARIDRERQAVVLGGRECLVRSYPISVEWPSAWAEQAPPPAECRRAVFAELGLAPDALLGVGVDRLDYTKGIEERLLAVERLLERFPHLRGRFTFAQLAAPSRSLIESYRALDQRVEALAARINGRFGSGSYRPVVLLRAQHEPPAVFRYLRAADVCYVSSLHDGMNLVAKEFVSARDDERGVLVLSGFTGAARELTEALLVNPYDLEEASAALATAVAMPVQEQGDRMRAMRAYVADYNVYRWAGRMLTDAARVRHHGRLSQRLSMGVRALDEEPGRDLGRLEESQRP